ncbi:hypothetical protein DWB77_04079 [Streptomyces hundungensis]|uniref:Uncharacterized protein n=1 Tax=Streptomyces hundungensis TaxID=1077946 RepID=A0A387HM38_9ACTN|nr:hypothetical protein [Streptomyces hundungensis]AYG81912.1 hypothetical protein DWB77_04079 [Streptomyces hundungensis]
MTEIETDDGPAVGARRTRGNLYAYRVRGRVRSAVVLWAGGRGDEPDRVCTAPDDGPGQVPVFVTVRQARMYARRRGWKPATPEAGTLELRRIEHWLEDPRRRKAPPGPVLDAWNFFEDLARGLEATTALPRQGPVHGNAYEKLFAGECAAWTPDEQHAVRELLTAGVELWNSCPVAANPRSVRARGR